MRTPHCSVEQGASRVSLAWTDGAGLYALGRGAFDHDGHLQAPVHGRTDCRRRRRVYPEAKRSRLKGFELVATVVHQLAALALDLRCVWRQLEVRSELQVDGSRRAETGHQLELVSHYLVPAEVQRGAYELRLNRHRGRSVGLGGHECGR